MPSPEPTRVHFDQRTQTALREVGGLSTGEQRAVSEAVVEATRRDAEELARFFEGRDRVYSDMDRAHSNDEFPEHDVEFLDLYTHADEVRGYLRFDSWGVYVDGGRILGDDLVELTLGPTVHGRVRFAPSRDRL